MGVIQHRENVINAKKKVISEIVREKIGKSFSNFRFFITFSDMAHRTTLVRNQSERLVRGPRVGRINFVCRSNVRGEICWKIH